MDQNTPQYPQSAPPVYQPPQAEEPRSRSSIKKWITILFLVLLAGAAYIIYDQYGTQIIKGSLSQTDWKTYRNEQYGFEFKYPDDLTLIDVDNHISIESHYNVIGHINIYSGNIAEEVQKIKQDISDIKDSEIISEKTISANNLEFSQIIADFPESGTIQNVYNFTQKDGLVYGISFFIDQKDFPFEQILSTFKFIDKSSATR